MITPEDFIKKVNEYCDRDINIVKMEINDNEKYHYYTLFCSQYVPMIDGLGYDGYMIVYTTMNIPYKDLIFHVDELLPIIKENLICSREEELKKRKVRKR